MKDGKSFFFFFYTIKVIVNLFFFFLIICYRLWFIAKWFIGNTVEEVGHHYKTTLSNIASYVCKCIICYLRSKYSQRKLLIKLLADPL